MKDTYLSSFEKNLSEIASGTFQIHQYPGDTKFLCHFTDSFSTETKGKGRIQVYSLFPGIQLAFHQYLGHRGYDESCRIASSASTQEQRSDRQQTLWQRGILSSSRYEPGAASAPHD